MQQLGKLDYNILKKEGKKHGNLGVQAFLRAVVIPDWLEEYRKADKPESNRSG